MKQNEKLVYSLFFHEGFKSTFPFSSQLRATKIIFQFYFHFLFKNKFHTNDNNNIRKRLLGHNRNNNDCNTLGVEVIQPFSKTEEHGNHLNNKYTHYYLQAIQ